MTDIRVLTSCAGPDCTALSLTDTAICQSCAARITRALRHIPHWYRQCGERHLRSAAPAWEQRSGRPGPRVPVNPAAASARARVEGVLASWAGLVVQETGAAAPRRVVVDLCRFLLSRLEVLLRHEAAGEFVREVDELATELDGVVRPYHGRRLGPCVVQGCPGTLIGGGPNDSLHVTCDHRREHSWAGSEVLSLGDVRDAHRRPRWLGANDVASLWGIARGSVYRLANEHGWARCRRSGRTYYATEDVRRTLG